MEYKILINDVNNVFKFEKVNILRNNKMLFCFRYSYWGTKNLFKIINIIDVKNYEFVEIFYICVNYLIFLVIW